MPDIDTLHPLKLSIPKLEAQQVLNLGHNKLYALLRRGELEAVKDGPRTYITVESIRAYQERRPKAIFLSPAPPVNNFHTLRKPTRRRSKARA